MDVSEDVTATLRAEAHGNLPAVIDSPKLMKLRSGKEGGGKGPLIQDNLSGTITVGNDQTLFEPVCYGISSYESNSMKSDNPHSGVYEADTSRTIDLNGGNPACNQGGIAVVEALPFNTTQITSPKNGNNPQWGDACHTLAATDHAPAICTVQGPESTAYSASKTSYFTQATEEIASTLVATDYKDPLLINVAGCDFRINHTVRRLTPTECARLQGFPDDWSHLAPFNPEDAEFWEQVRKTYAEINGKTYKPAKDIKKWYDKLHTDSAEYKMWGNGIALPNAEYVLEGLALQGVKTLGSLFDGSGGFPFAGVKCGITPLWASEVEPYPIAVTKSKSWLWG